jgi:prevent-host-death family protein
VNTVPAAKIAAQFDDSQAAIREQPVLITRNGKPDAVLLVVRNRAQAEQLVGHSRSLRSIFAEAHEDVQKRDEFPHDQFWREVEQS